MGYRWVQYHIFTARRSASGVAVSGLVMLQPGANEATVRLLSQFQPLAPHECRAMQSVSSRSLRLPGDLHAVKGARHILRHKSM